MVSQGVVFSPCDTVRSAGRAPASVGELPFSEVFPMSSPSLFSPRLAIAALFLVATGAGMCGPGLAAPPTVTLSGAQEVPAIDSPAVGTSSIIVGADRSVTGTVVTSNIEGTVAHIHQGAKGTNGPVLVMLIKTSAIQWSVPAGTQLTEAQYDSYKAGGLYVNVHSAAHPAGEIRAQLQ